MHERVAAGLADAERALAEGAWAQARQGFEAVLAVEDVPEAQWGLGLAYWWLGELVGTLECLQQAYAGFRRRGDAMGAAAAALRLGFHQRVHMGNAVVARGWLGRATRLVREAGLDALRGELALMQACVAGDAPAAEQLAREALALARDTQDSDLELCALSQLGASLVQQGRVREGVALLDESMAAALAGEGAQLDTVVFTSCNMIVSCAQCAELERAARWIEASVAFAERYGCPFLHAECRTIYGDVLAAQGELQRAEEELKVALALTVGAVPEYHAHALSKLASLYVMRGQIEQAERLLHGVLNEGPVAEVRARIHLLRGEVATAQALVQRRLATLDGDHLERSALLELLGEAALAQGDADGAAGHAREFVERGTDGDCRLMVGRGERLWGRALAATDADAASRHYQAALAAFHGLRLPYEAACTSLWMAQHLRLESPELAVVEARSALASFERLGASAQADVAAALLRSLGVKAARAGVRNAEVLTKRERDVLALLGEGLSNPEIAVRLHVSRKTVEHHVARVLFKLGLRGRAEAAAEAVRTLGVNLPPNR